MSEMNRQRRTWQGLALGMLFGSVFWGAVGLMWVIMA